MAGQSDIDQYLLHEIDVGSFPGAVYAVGSSTGIQCENALGHAITVPLRLATSLDTIYDCASITKPLITATLILQAVAEGWISLDDEFEGHTYRRLLTHTSGLRDWLPLYAYPDPLAAIREHGPEYEPGTRVVYSDLNFVLLYYAVTRIFSDYVLVARQRIISALHLHDTFFRPPSSLKPRIAATEWGQRFEMGMVASRGIVFNGFRESLIWGETHDGNSHHLGGTAGNAGLFATARDVFRIAQAWLKRELLPPDLIAEATKNYTAGLQENRGLGWILSAKDHAATGMLSERAFGHTGFTGTSVFIDPDADRIMVLMTNRVHPCASPVAMQKIRGEFHRLAL